METRDKLDLPVYMGCNIGLAKVYMISKTTGNLDLFLVAKLQYMYLYMYSYLLLRHSVSLTVLMLTTVFSFPSMLNTVK